MLDWQRGVGRRTPDGVDLYRRPELVEKVGPVLHELDALRPVKSAVVCSSSLILILMGECSFDHVAPTTALVQDRARGRPEAMSAHFFLGISHPPQCRIHRVLGKRSVD